MAYNTVLAIWEILQKVEVAASKKEKVELLKKNESWALKDTIRCAYDNTLEFNLPKGSPPYVANKPESAPSSILRRYKEYSYFIKGGKGESLPDYKREQMFIGLLESVHPEEAVYLVKMKDKEGFAGLTRATINDAFPGLIKSVD